MVGELNAKHVDWHSPLTTARGTLLLDYANKISCLIYRPLSLTSVQYNRSAIRDVFDIVVTRNVVTACCALSSDHLPVLNDTSYRPSHLNLLTALISDGLPGPNSRHACKMWFRLIRNWRGSYRHVRWGLVLRYSKDPGCFYSQESSACWPAASNTGSCSEWNT